MGLTPLSRQESWKATAPNMLPWSVTATAFMPSRPTWSTTSSMWLAPSSRLYSVWRWRWTNSPPLPMVSVPTLASARQRREPGFAGGDGLGRERTAARDGDGGPAPDGHVGVEALDVAGRRMAVVRHAPLVRVRAHGRVRDHAVVEPQPVDDVDVGQDPARHAHGVRGQHGQRRPAQRRARGAAGEAARLAPVEGR